MSCSANVNVANATKADVIFDFSSKLIKPTFQQLQKGPELNIQHTKQ